MEVLSSTYRQLFERTSPATEQLDPASHTSRLLGIYDQCRGNAQALLLWLSIVRKLFTPAEDVLIGIGKASKAPAIQGDLEAIRKGLLQAQSLVPMLIESMSTGDQLVCYLASKDLHLVLIASQCIQECWLKEVFSLISLPYHESLYSVQFFKHILKSLRKSDDSHEENVSLCCAFITSRWKEVLAELSSKLRGGGGGKCSSKWPELNFVSFLSMTVEVLRHGRLALGKHWNQNAEGGKHWNQSAEGCHELIGGHLEGLTVTVTERCALSISLKELLKVYNMIIDNSLTHLGTTEQKSETSESISAELDTAESKSDISKSGTAESESKTAESAELESITLEPKEAAGAKSCEVLMEQLEACLPKLFLSTMMARIVTTVLQDFSITEDAEMCNLSKSIVRRAVLLLMKYASLLEDKSAVLNFEVMMSALSRDCGLASIAASSRADLPPLRHALFHLMNEQDDDVIEMLSLSCKLCKKQTLWTNHPVLQFCAHVTSVHALVLEFLLSVSYDHSILLDFIVSPETCQFDRFLVEYFEVCVSSWSDLTAACQEMDPYDVEQATAALCSLKCEDRPSPSPSSSPSSSLAGEPYRDNTLDKAMDCFTTLKYSLVRLTASKLLPFPVNELISILSQAEDVYESV